MWTAPSVRHDYFQLLIVFIKEASIRLVNAMVSKRAPCGVWWTLAVRSKTPWISSSPTPSFPAPLQSTRGECQERALLKCPGNLNRAWAGDQGWWFPPLHKSRRRKYWGWRLLCEDDHNYGLASKACQQLWNAIHKTLRTRLHSCHIIAVIPTY